MQFPPDLTLAGAMGGIIYSILVQVFLMLSLAFGKVYVFLVPCLCTTYHVIKAMTTTEPSPLALLEILEVTVSPLLFRGSFLLFILFHEWSHTFAELVFSKDLSVFSRKNISANTSLEIWVTCLNPFQSIPKSFCPCVVVDKKVKQDGCSQRVESYIHRYEIVKFAGWFSSLIIFMGTFGLGDFCRNMPPIYLWTIQNASLCALIGATVTDLYSSDISHDNRAHSVYYCGNFGLILSSSLSKATKPFVDVWSVLENMAAISTQRGGQSGGIVAFLSNQSGMVQGVRTRVRPSKRQSLAFLLRSRSEFYYFLTILWEKIKGFFKRLFRFQGGGFSSPIDARLFIGHTRFATSSIPLASETHPHQWTPQHYCSVWDYDDSSGSLQPSQKLFGLYITHNGDFEFWNLFGRDRTYSEIGLWLSKVLGRPPSASCDSVMIAGLLELFRTQGLWVPSFRLAFQQVVVVSYEQVVVPQFRGSISSQIRGPIGALSEKQLTALADVAEEIFRTCCSGGDPLIDSSDMQSLKGFLLGDDLEYIKERIFYDMRKKVVFLDVLPDSTVHRFVAQSVTNFLENDLFWAVKKFMEHAKGSFGMAVGCTLDSNCVVLSALNQPLSMGISTKHEAVIYSSESQALNVPLCLENEDDNKTQIAFRLDLDEDEGEIVEITMKDPEFEVAQRLSVVGNGVRSLMDDVENGEGNASKIEDGQPFTMERAPFMQLRIHNRKKNSPVTEEALIQGGRLIRIEGNPYVNNLLSQPIRGDVVGKDIKDIPQILSTIRKSWGTEGTLNRQTANAFFDMIKEKATSRHVQGSDEAQNRREIDVLVVGVENSLWIAEQFAADLQNLLPQLRVVPISANKVIGVMGNARGAISTAGFSFCRISTLLTPASVVLCVSQSGQTFPTLHATRILSKHCKNRVFVCVGILDSKMSTAVEQGFHETAQWKSRIFFTHAGWREAEPATASVVACHATLTELMLFMAAKFKFSSGIGLSPLGLRLTAADIADLQRIHHSCVDYTIKDIVGPSELNRELKKQGFKWALHILETPIAWGLSATYILCSVMFGVPIFTVLRRWMALDFRAAVYVAHALDSAVYIFLPLIFALLLRLVTRRKLFSRIGSRTIVIADVPYVHQLVESYVSKLFSLSFWMATVEAHGANPIDHFVHRFTHRVKRGLLLAVGRPDGRLCSQTKCESWVLMAVMQARFILSLGSGAEVLTLGHNPHTSPEIDNHITLPSSRPQFLCEKLLGVDEFEPMKRMATRKHAVQKSTASEPVFADMDGQVVGAHHYFPLEGSLLKARRQGLQMFAYGRREIEEQEMSNPRARGFVISAMDLDVQKLLDSQAALEEITENRFLSLERLISFHVMFHNMATTVASFWPLKFDTWRSQSCLRIATTAAPVSAADLEREWMDSFDEREVTVNRSIHRRRVSRG